MNSAKEKPFFLSSIGKKYLMAFSGIVWAGFILTHMAGNMLIFVSPEAYNAYGHAITSGLIIYPTELLLIGTLLLHVFLAVKVTLENRKARGHRYAMTPNGSKGSSLASKFMAIQGSIVLVFIILHLTTFKYGIYYETTVNGVVMRDLARLMREVFAQPGYVVWYMISLVLLWFHLSHGFGSVFQSLGIRNDRFAPMIHKLSIVYATVVIAGFISQPIYIFLNNR